MRLTRPSRAEPGVLTLAAALEFLVDPPGGRPPAAGRPARTPTRATAAALGEAGVACEVVVLDDLEDGSADVLLLLADELSAAGEHAEGLVARVAAVLPPGGLVVASAVSELPARVVRGGPDADPPPRRFTAAGLRGLLAHRGFELAVHAAPGAGARLAGAPPRWDARTDREPGLLDTTPQLLVAATAPTSPHARSRAFFSSLAQKVVAAAVVCRDAQGRLLCVHDTFKGHWTIPGGAVDADEDLATAAERETWEEAGVRVRAGAVLGTFTASWPDRVIVVFEAVLADPADAEPAPVHEHEIDAAAWLPLEEALRRLGATPRAQVERCLATPHRAWRD